MRWVEDQTPDGLLVRRAAVPDRWDIAVARDWPVGPLGDRAKVCRRVARQIRQDVWRAIQATRGFSPRILVAFTENQLYITAGGVLVNGRAPPGLADRIAGVLDKPDNRRRWVRFAARHGGK